MAVVRRLGLDGRSRILPEELPRVGLFRIRREQVATAAVQAEQLRASGADVEHVDGGNGVVANWRASLGAELVVAASS